MKAKRDKVCKMRHIEYDTWKTFNKWWLLLPFCRVSAFDTPCKSETLEDSFSEHLADPSNSLQTFGSKRRQIN